MQEGGSAPGPGRAVPTLAPTGQVYYGGVRGMGEGPMPSAWGWRGQAPLGSCNELPGSAAMLFTECCLKGRDWHGGRGADGEGEEQFRLLRTLSLGWRGATYILDSLQVAWEPKRTGLVSTHPLLTKAACCCYGDSNTNLLPSPPPTAVWSPVKGVGCLFLVTKGNREGEALPPLPRLSRRWSETLRVLEREKAYWSPSPASSLPETAASQGF